MKTQTASQKIIAIPTELNSQWNACALAHSDVSIDPLLQLLRSQNHLMQRIENMKTKIQELELRLSAPRSLTTPTFIQH